MLLKNFQSDLAWIEMMSQSGSLCVRMQKMTRFKKVWKELKPKPSLSLSRQKRFSAFVKVRGYENFDNSTSSSATACLDHTSCGKMPLGQFDNIGVCRLIHSLKPNK